MKISPLTAPMMYLLILGVFRCVYIIKTYIQEISITLFDWCFTLDSGMYPLHDRGQLLTKEEESTKYMLTVSRLGTLVWPPGECPSVG